MTYEFRLCLVLCSCCFWTYYSFHVSCMPSKGIRKPLGLFSLEIILKPVKGPCCSLIVLPVLPWEHKRDFVPQIELSQLIIPSICLEHFNLFLRIFHACLLSSSQGVKFQGQIVLYVASWPLEFLALAFLCATEY